MPLYLDDVSWRVTSKNKEKQEKVHEKTVKFPCYTAYKTNLRLSANSKPR